MRRVLMDQGSAVEIMYHDLHKGLNLKSEDLMAYESPLISFEGKTVIPKCQIRLPIQTDSENSGGGFHCGRFIFPLYIHCGQALAPYSRGCLLYPASKGEISF